jgi:hypothetical protein
MNLLRSLTPTLLALCSSIASAAGAPVVTPLEAITDPPAAQPEVQVPGSRGRDPWVFRCLFEDRSRMLVVAPRPKVWFAFNISAGALYKAWSGDMEFRGKVWDFSQNSSRAKGRSLLSWTNDLVQLPDKVGQPARGWSAEGVEYKDGWSFSSAGSVLTSPSFDATSWTRLFIAYEELSHKGPARVEVSTDGGKSWDAQWFDTTMHGSRDDEWQWGFKQVAVEPTAAMRVRFRQLDPAFAKRLRSIRVFGDHIAWWIERDGHTVSAEITWIGHELVKQTEGVTLRFRAAGVEIDESLDASTESGSIHLTERLNVHEMPASSANLGLRLALPSLGPGGARTCSAAGAIREWNGAQALFVDKPGIYEITSTFPEKEAGR